MATNTRNNQSEKSPNSMNSEKFKKCEIIFIIKITWARNYHYRLIRNVRLSKCALILNCDDDLLLTQGASSDSDGMYPLAHSLHCFPVTPSLHELWQGSKKVNLGQNFSKSIGT